MQSFNDAGRSRGVVWNDHLTERPVQYSAENQHVSGDSDDSMYADSAIAGRPGKHQDSIQRHEFLGPDEAR